MKAFRAGIDKNGLPVKVIKTGSFGFYDIEPIVAIEAPDSVGVLYHSVAPEDVPFLIGNCCNMKFPKWDKALCWTGKQKVNGIPYIDELALFKLQSRTALRNCGWIDPENINHYIVQGQGYSGLSQALQMEKGKILGALKESSLRGRNGIGSSTVDAWKACFESEVENKFLICNAIDADPQALTARLLFESDPHSVLEGMLISAYAAGVSRCFIFVKENADFTRRIKKALEQMRAYNLLGVQIMDTQFSAEIELIQVPANSILGYRTELFRCIDEKQSLPHVHPICSVPDEFSHRPVVVTSPEAMSHLSANPVRDIREEKASKVITLAGSIAHRYTVEVDSETTIRCIVEELGGGTCNGKNVKAAKLAGPAGIFLLPDLFYKSLCSVIGEEPDLNFCLNTIEIFDSDRCMVDATREIMSYIQEQSCGRCIFCREGSLQMLAILEDIAADKGKPEDLELLTELGGNMRQACLCAFGRAAPDPVLSSIEHFQDEYAEKIKKSV
jgi:NADH-quinone oxidoreductase subunit F